MGDAPSTAGEGTLDILETIPAMAHCDVEISQPMTAQCPVDDHTDEYDVTITYKPQRGHVLEVQSVKRYLNAYSDVEISQERLCSKIYDDINAVADPESLTVTIEGSHYGVSVVTTETGE